LKLYVIFARCTISNNAYVVVGNFTFDALSFTIDIRDCFYNLPVFYVTSGGTVFDSTPCAMLANNKTATVQIVVETYLPDNLEAVFGVKDYCCTSSVTGEGGVAFNCAAAGLKETFVQLPLVR
jgi:hypothetical protein